MTEWAAKRFWDKASVQKSDAGFSVLLDGRSVRTPAKAPLIVPTQALAEKVAGEWDAQIEKIDPLSMPFTRSANAAVDKVAIQHQEVANLIAAYGETDLLCYRAQSPQALIDRQAQAWDPLLEWAKDQLGVELQIAQGVMYIAQPAESITRLHTYVHGFDAFGLTALHDLVSLSGSLILGLAAVRDAQNPETLWAISRIDETWQEEQWGLDVEATELAVKKKNSFFHALDFYRSTQKTV